MLDVVPTGADHALTGAVRLTHAGQLLGTPDFIAPKQITDAQGADIRADIYSLGCTLYYLLSGRPPFRAAKLNEVLRLHHGTDARLLNLVRPEVPAELAAVVAKMMAKEADRRYQTPIEVAKALVRFFTRRSAETVSPNPGTAPGDASVADRAAAEQTHVETQAVMAPVVAPAANERPAMVSTLDEFTQSGTKSAGVTDAAQPPLQSASSLAPTGCCGRSRSRHNRDRRHDHDCRTVTSQLRHAGRKGCKHRAGARVADSDRGNFAPFICRFHASSASHSKPTSAGRAAWTPAAPRCRTITNTSARSADGGSRCRGGKTDRDISCTPADSVGGKSRSGDSGRRAVLEGFTASQRHMVRRRKRSQDRHYELDHTRIDDCGRESGVAPDSQGARILRGFGPNDLHSTYAISLQTMVFAAAEPERDKLRIANNVRWLERAQIKPGDTVTRPRSSLNGSPLWTMPLRWPGSWTYSDSKRGRNGDNSNTQFALLGLYAAREVGVAVDPMVWELSRQYWEGCQEARRQLGLHTRHV